MNIQTAFPSRYLKAADLGDKHPVVTIADVVMEEIGDDKLPVLTMRGKDKALVLNRTNSNMIAEIAGTFETDQWRGVQIQLYATKTDYQGKRVACVRVEAPAKPAQAAAAMTQIAPPPGFAARVAALAAPPAPTHEPLDIDDISDDSIPF